MQLILLVKQNTQTKGRLILYNLTFIDGEELRVNLGEIHISYLFLPIPTKINESVLLAQASQEDISSVKPFIVLTNHLRAVASEMRVCCRTPLHKKNILVNFLTL